MLSKRAVPPAPASPVEFPEELPISARVRDIAQAIAEHQVVIVAGETGSGKTTQLPKICLAMGRGLERHIGVTEPRRIAATSVAARVAKELGVELGREVGYKIRFADKSSKDTYVRFMTDGILLAEIQGDPLLSAYDTLIVDEAHERSLNIDFLLGYVKRLSPKRPDLRVIISSATLEIDRFSAFYDKAPVIQVSGRTYPVEVIYRPPQKDEADLAATVAAVVDEITSLDPREDVLVFLPGEREIHECESAIFGRAIPRTVVLPLYGRLSQTDQARVFQTLPERRVVLATNVAETSLTIPGIVYVVDSGLARVNRHNPRSGVTQLLVEPISRASADQRKGRAGRLRSGVCFRLCEEQEHALRPAFTDPEILRVGLAGAILQMKALGLGPIESFPFLDPPPKRAVDEGYRTLEEIGAMDGDGDLTDIGKRLSRLPLDPRVGRMLLAGEAEGSLREVLILAAALGGKDPRERPIAQQQRADEVHRRFRDEASDFATLLKIWHLYHAAQQGKTQGQLRKWCRDHFLSYVRMREWADIHHQLARATREMGLEPNQEPAGDEAVHRAILAGLLSRIGVWNAEQRAYFGARHTKFQLHPSSGLSKKPPAWVVAAELVETSQLFARVVAKIDPAWLEALGGPLCKRSYGDPHYSEKTAQVMASESVSLYGLPVVRDRSVHYGPIDPKASRRIFLDHALVRGEYASKAPFVAHNRALMAEVKLLRDKARKSDMLADDHAIAAFFDAKVPDDVYSGKTFERRRAEIEQRDPKAFFLALTDVLAGDDSAITPDRYPDKLSLFGAELPLSYRFDPGEEDDGVTVSLPFALLPQADPAVFEHVIPGFHHEKVRLLIASLPKAIRKAISQSADLTELVAGAIRPFEEPLLGAIAREIHALTGVRVPVTAFNVHELPPWLHLTFRVTEGAHTLAAGKDLGALRDRFALKAREAWEKLPKQPWERQGLTSWTFDALPERVAVEVGGAVMAAYPAIVDHESTVAVEPFASKVAAVEATRAGLMRLYLIQMGTSLAKIEAQIPASLPMNALAGGGKASLTRMIALRALEECFDLADPARFPRTKAAFSKQLDAGRPKLAKAIAELARLAQDIALPLEKVHQQLRALNGKPGAPKAALDDVRAQLAALVPPSLLRSTPRERLVHVPRYLRAVEVRLERLPNGPQKDQAKAAQVMPFWADWQRHKDGLLARGVPAEDIESFRWLIEELRVSVFAPELRTPVPVSAQRLTEQWRAIAG